MSIKTTYKCDRCGGERPTADQFWRLGIHVNNVSAYTNGNYPMHTMEVCRPCLEELGFHRSKPTPGQPEQPPVPTLEDLIREIVTTAMLEQQS